MAPVVTGTSNPNVDVPAVQTAVDGNPGGNVVLKGHFSFDMPPSAPTPPVYKRMVTISNGVTISGHLDANGHMPIIECGNWPFLINGGGRARHDSRIALCTPPGGRDLDLFSPRLTHQWLPDPGGKGKCRVWDASGCGPCRRLRIFAGADPHPPGTGHPGIPDNFSGTPAVLSNEIDVGANFDVGDAALLGVVMFAVGTANKEVNILVSGNTIMHVTAPAINFRVVGGRALAERNVLITGNISVAKADVIRLVGSGSYVIARNTIDCGWQNGTATGATATGINVIGKESMMPISNAIVVDNDVTMSAPNGTHFTGQSAGIEMQGFSRGNSVLNNRVRGRARAALSLIDLNGGMPGDNSPVLNDVADFHHRLRTYLSMRVRPTPSFSDTRLA